MNPEHLRVLELEEKANALPYGASRIAMLEEAVRLADSLSNIELAFDVRNSLMQAAVFGGRPDILLVAFAWCLAQYDRNPEEFNDFQILWKYKWVVANGCQFPQIKRARLEELLADMERRYRAAGSTMHAVALERLKLLESFGERKLAKQAHDEFCKLKRDRFSDCPACVAYSIFKFHSNQRQWELALKAAEPVLQNHFTCGEQPHLILSGVLLPLLLLGQLEEAKGCQKKGYRLVSQGRQFVAQHGEQIRFLVLIGELPQAKQLLERHLSGALEAVVLDERFTFLLAACLFTDCLIKRGTHSIKIRLPQGAPPPDATGKVDVKSLGGWFKEQAEDIAKRFDERNGTNAFQEQIDRLPTLLSYAIE